MAEHDGVAEVFGARALQTMRAGRWAYRLSRL